MPANRPPRYDFTAALHSHLTCALCGARQACPLTALVRYARRGWPRCCGEVMILTDEADGECVDGAPAAAAQAPAG